MSEHAVHGAHHRNYVKIWGTLVVLLLISVFGPLLEIRVVTLITAFGVALFKAYLVAKNFMHLDIEKPIVHWILVSVLILMVLLFAGVAPDVMKEDGRRWTKDARFHNEAGAGGGAHGGGTHDGDHGNKNGHE